MTPLRCERCARPGHELALCISSFDYLCERCWGSGEHVCERCETELACCSCRGKGCNLCALSPVGLDARPSVEAQS